MKYLIAFLMAAVALLCLRMPPAIPPVMKFNEHELAKRRYAKMLNGPSAALIALGRVFGGVAKSFNETLLGFMSPQWREAGAVDIYDTNVLRGVVANLKEPASFLLDRFFPFVQTSDGKKKISFDVENRKRRITPFVSPKVAGKVVESQGFDTKTFTPAYAKDKREFDPDHPLRRQMGEQIGGSMSAMDRRNMSLRLAIEDQLRMLTLREEVMAAEALRLSQVTVSGEGYDTVVVNYGRAAALTLTLTGDDRWNIDEPASAPLDDLEAWATLIQDDSGSVPTSVVMEPTAWQAFRAKAEVKDALDTRRGSTSVAETGPLDGRIARMVGRVGDFEIWVYQQSYVDEADVTQKVMPTGTVIMGGPDIEGARAYGAIQDEKAGYQSDRFFIKSWLEEDPAVRWLLLQSAPLVVPYRPGASLAATVL